MIARLTSRAVYKVAGADARQFLQDVITNDMHALEKGSEILYACLLTPQGMFLHDMFVSRYEDGYLLECESARKADLLKRLTFLKLRAKVTIEDMDERLFVYVADTPQEGLLHMFKDPRMEAFTFCRGYAPALLEGTAIGLEQAYHDARIALGIPEGGAEIAPSKDVLANVNLDCLHAIAYTKGCYIGQEVTNRIKNRGLVKRRLVVVKGEQLHAGENLYSLDSHREIGEIRAINSNENNGLAVIKLEALEGAAVADVATETGQKTSVCLPGYLRG